MRAQFLLFCTIFLVVLSLTACTRERSTPEPTTAPAVTTPAGGQGSSEPVVETVGTAETAASPSPAAGASTPEPTATRQVFQYTVAAGDTLSSIAAFFGVSMQQLRELNNLTDDSIFAGQILRIPEGEPTPTPEPFRHVVQAGETLSSIATRYGLSTLTLIEVNSIQDPDSLIVGASLLIPGVTAPSTDSGTTGSGASSDAGGVSLPDDSQEPVIHVVQPNETLYSIAADYGVSTADIIAVNSISNPNILRSGQRLLIPGVTPRQALEARGIRHTVQSGESLSEIARRYGVPVAEIMAANGLTDPNTIMVGQELLIPQ
ncbi:MAG: LysM peptidoglycan-binding domain-containing protein [Caldilinea sp.]